MSGLPTPPAIKLSKRAIVIGLIALAIGALFLLGRCSAPDKGAETKAAVAEDTRVVLEKKVASDDVAAVEQVRDDARLRAREKGLDDAINHPGLCAPPAAWQRHACEQLRAQAADRGVEAGLPEVCGCPGFGGPGAAGE